jgi:hypothetical protein
MMAVMVLIPAALTKTEAVAEALVVQAEMQVVDLTELVV